MRRLFSAVACALLCAGMLAPQAARADSAEAEALSKGVIWPAGTMLENDLVPADGAQVSQANPVGTPHAPLRKPGLPQGLTYNIDLSVNYAYGDVGYNAKLPGGLDAGLGYGFTRWNRLQVGYFEIPQYPVSFSNKNVPFFVQGYTGPGTIPQTIQSTGNVDVTTKDKILTIVDQNLINIGKLPIVISPSYLAHWGTVGGSTDVATIQYDGYPSTLHLRTEQEYFLAVTVPFLASPRFFGTATVAPQWLVHPAGVNQTNHMQLFELAYIEYHASRKTTIFFQPSRLIQYNPSDPYPEYTPTFIYGLSYKFTPLTYTQWVVSTGGATNYPAFGITSLTCQRLPCTPGNTYPSLGGLKATSIQLKFGIGSPTVVPL